VGAFYQAGIQDQLHYLDNFFLFFSPPAVAPVSGPLQVAVAVLDYLGFPIALEKEEGPACQVTFLGVIIDSVAFELRLPQEKSHEVAELAQGVDEHKGTYKEGAGVAAESSFSRCYSGAPKLDIVQKLFVLL